MLARKGDPKFVALLKGPEYPIELDYLRTWSEQLHGRSGVGMNGLAPLTYSTIADWSRLTGIVPLPHEVEALLTLDAVKLHPGEVV